MSSRNASRVEVVAGSHLQGLLPWIEATVARSLAVLPGPGELAWRRSSRRPYVRHCQRSERRGGGPSPVRCRGEPCGDGRAEGGRPRDDSGPHFLSSVVASDQWCDPGGRVGGAFNQFDVSSVCPAIAFLVSDCIRATARYSS